MPLKCYDLSDLQRAIKDKPIDSIIAIEDPESEITWYEQSYLGVKFFSAFEGCPPAIIFSVGQEITKDHNLYVREGIWLENDGKYLPEGR